MQDWQPFLNRHQQCMRQGRFEQALLVANEVIKRHPEGFAGYAMMGDALYGAGDYRQASACYQVALQKDDRRATVHNMLARACRLLGDDAAALRSFERALALAPEDPQINASAGDFLACRGRFAEAQTLLARAVDQGSAEAASLLLRLYERCDDTDGMRRVLRERRALLTTSGPAALLNVAGALLKLGETEEALDCLGRIAPAGLSATNTSVHQHLTGVAHERLGNHAAAFAAWRRQNEAGCVTYRPRYYEALARRVLAGAAAGPAAAVPGAGAGPAGAPACESAPATGAAPVPVFVVGLPRAGTTLTERILAVADEVVAGGELPLLPTAAQHLLDGTATMQDVATWYAQRLQALVAAETAGTDDAEDGADGGHEADAAPRAAAADGTPRCPGAGPEATDAGDEAGGGVRWIVDKLPRNYFYLDVAARLFPQARVIYCRRHPLDNGLSLYRQNFSAGHDYATDLSAIAHFIGLERRIMAHWLAHPPLPVFTLDYEALVADFDAVTQRLYRFLDLPWHARVRNFHRSSRYAATASFDQVRQPINGRAVGAWRRHAAALQPLVDGLRAQGVALASRGSGGENLPSLQTTHG